MNFNALYVILILCGILIKCCRTDIEFLGFEYNIIQNFIHFDRISKNLKYTKLAIPQNPSGYEIQKKSTPFEYNQILVDFKQSQLNTIRFLSIK